MYRPTKNNQTTNTKTSSKKTTNTYIYNRHGHRIRVNNKQNTTTQPTKQETNIPQSEPQTPEQTEDERQTEQNNNEQNKIIYKENLQIIDRLKKLTLEINLNTLHQKNVIGLMAVTGVLPDESWCDKDYLDFCDIYKLTETIGRAPELKKFLAKFLCSLELNLKQRINIPTYYEILNTPPDLIKVKPQSYEKVNEMWLIESTGKYTPRPVFLHCECPKCYFDNFNYLYKCGKCMNIIYCSKFCQKTDWSNHKKVCQEQN